MAIIERSASKPSYAQMRLSEFLAGEKSIPSHFVRLLAFSRGWFPANVIQRTITNTKWTRFLEHCYCCCCFCHSKECLRCELAHQRTMS